MRKTIAFSLLLLIGINVFSEDESDFTEENSSLERIVTYIETPVVEQRQKISKEEIESLHSESLTSLFQSEGIQILSYGTYGLESKPSIRGFTDETVRIILDGVCVNNEQYGTFDFASLNIDEVENIEIVKGGFSEDVLSEGAVGGTIYITTKSTGLGRKYTSDSLFKTYFAANVLDTFSQSLGFSTQIKENSFFKINTKVCDAKNEYPFIDYRGGIKNRKNAHVNDLTNSMSFSHYFDNGKSWSIMNKTYAGYKHIPGTETSNNEGLQEDYDNNLMFVLKTVDEKLRVNESFSWMSNTRFYKDNREDSEHYLNTFSNSIGIDLLFFDKIKQSFGMQLKFVALNSSNDGEKCLFSGAFNEISKIKINDLFSICVPLSLKFSNENFAFVPKFGFRFDYKKVSILLNGYRLIQFPNMDDLYWKSSATAEGNSDLNKETGWGGEFSFNVHDVFIPFSFCVFSNYYQSKIQWAYDEDSLWRPKNIASALYLGANFSIEKSFLKYFSIKSNFEYIYTRLMDESNELTYGNQIMWVPDLTGAITFFVKTDYFNFAIDASYTGKKYISNLNLNYTEPYVLVNLSAELKMIKHIIPYLRIDNLFDVDYKSVPEYPMPGISLSLGVKAEF